MGSDLKISTKELQEYILNNGFRSYIQFKKKLFLIMTSLGDIKKNANINAYHNSQVNFYT